MNVKKMLYDYPYILQEVHELNAKLQGILEDKYNIQVTANLTGMPSSGEVSDPVYKTVEQIMLHYDQEVKAIESEIKGLLDRHSRITEAMKLLSPDERRIIELRCFKRKKWREVAVEVRYSRAQCHRIFESGVEKMRKK